ncbi:hypothetical protein D3C86_1753710 [compost metagenome]
MLIIRAIAGGKADLRQGIVKPGALGNLRQLAVIVCIPTGTLRDLADHQATRHVRDPVGELDRFIAHGFLLSFTFSPDDDRRRWFLQMARC